MLAKIAIGMAVFLVIFLTYVSTRNGHFHYERSGLINAPAAKIYPYLSDFKLGHEWSPYEKKDLNMKKTLNGPEATVGSSMEFEGNNEVGAGKLTFTKIVQNELVGVHLSMTKPMSAENEIEYKLTPEGNGTRFTWSMSGDGGFMGKLMGVLIDCEKMIAGDFEKGIENLKAVVESK